MIIKSSTFFLLVVVNLIKNKIFDSVQKISRLYHFQNEVIFNRYNNYESNMNKLSNDVYRN